MFECPYCGKKKEDTLSNGRANKSCGCQRGKRGIGKANRCGTEKVQELFYDVLVNALKPSNLEECFRCAFYAVEIWDNYETPYRTRVRARLHAVNRLYKRAA
jgi:hypothetical protein